MAMGSDDVGALVERLALRIAELELHALTPDFHVARVVDVLPVEPDVEAVVVAEDEPEVTLQVIGLELDGTAHPYVAVGVAPAGTDV